MSYMVQVPVSQCDELLDLVGPVWEDMRSHYRRPENHGGTTAPVLRVRVKPRYKTDGPGDSPPLACEEGEVPLEMHQPPRVWGNHGVDLL